MHVLMRWSNKDNNNDLSKPIRLSLCCRRQCWFIADKTPLAGTDFVPPVFD